MSKQPAPNISHSFTVRLEIPNQFGMFAKILKSIADVKGDPGGVDVVRADKKVKVRDLTIMARDEPHARMIVDSIRKVKGVRVVHYSDRVFLMHLGGKICIQNKIPVTTRDALSMAYTPGVARVCQAIAEDKRKVNTLTIKRNAVAVVTDGTAVLGLGDIGPEAAMPVMEGKAMLFKEFGDIDAYPICLQTKVVDEIVSAVKWIATGFGGINLEDISAPRCFEIEERLKKELDIPVFHDDQHGTAVVVLASTINSLRLLNLKLNRIKILIVGAGAAGVAITKILLSAGAKNIVVCDQKGILGRHRLPELNSSKAWLVEKTNPDNLKGSIVDAANGAHLFVGVSGPETFPLKALKKMAKNRIVFALANPIPEIMPEEALPHVRIMATGRSDYPNQINNVLAFPGIFRGALDARARGINEAMKLAAAHAIADCISKTDLSEEYIIPSVFNKQIVERVSRAVEAAAYASGIAKRKSHLQHEKLH
jgi:malate dehydrogenase (oxaloacetate-decarboxylating)